MFDQLKDLRYYKEMKVLSKTRAVFRILLSNSDGGFFNENC